MSEDLTRWLERLGLGQYVQSFIENDISLQILPDLSEADLEKLGVSMGHRKLLLRALKDATPAPPTATEVLEAPAAERRQLTVMFCDLAGSTELSQQLDPEDLREVNRAYQDACKAAIERYDGFVARYQGDGVLAYFGYPQAHEDDAERAIHAGLGVVEAMADLNETEGNKRDIELGVRVGIATGPVVVGDLIGEGASQESAVVGETPNLAARLQGLADKNAVMIGPGTHEVAGARFEYDDLGAHSLKGIAEPVQAWRVIAPVVAESRFDVTHRAGLTPLVGREHEIGLLLDRWEQAKEGDGQVVLLSGEAGIGKSRITEALRERTAGDDPVRLRYQCSPFYTNTALHPVIEQLQRAAHIEPDDANEVKLDKLEMLLNQGATDAEALAPLFAPLLSIPAKGRYAPLETTPERQKEQTLEALVMQMEGLSRQGPVLLIFEDIHWADPTSLELLELSIERVQRIPVLVVLTYRPEFSPPWSGHTHVTTLTLNRFTRSLASAMVENVTGGKPLPDEVLEQIIEKTDGVPLFVEELTKTILESGLLTEETDRYVAAGPPGDIAIPATLHDSLMARLDRLGEVKEVAQTASVIGREFDYDLLGAASPLSFEKLRDALNQLIDAELVFRRGRSEQGGYIFKHALVQDAAYGSLLKSKRQELHEHIALALQDRFPERVEAEPELLAHHFTEATLIEPAFEQWRRAGLRAADSFANAETVSHLSKALELFGRFDDRDNRAREELSLQTTLAAALTAVKGHAAPETGKAINRAHELCRRIGDTSQLLPVLYGAWNYKMVGGLVSEGLAAAEELLELAQRSGERTPLLAAHSALGTNLTVVGHLEAARDQLEKSVALHDPDKDRALSRVYGEHPAMFAMIWRGLTLGLMGFFSQATTQCHEAVKATRHGSDVVSGAGALFFSSWVCHLCGDSVKVGEHAQAAIDYSIEHYGSFHTWASMMKGWAMTDVGSSKEEGVRLIARVLMDDYGSGGGFLYPFFGSLLAQGHERCGDTEEAHKLIEHCLDDASRRHELLWKAELHWLRGTFFLSLRSPNAPEAETCFRQAIDVAREQGAKSLELRAATSLAQLYKSQGKRDEARNLLSPVYDWFTEGFDTAGLKEAKALLKQLS